jgi:phosphatidate phosphatase PAH1
MKGLKELFPKDINPFAGGFGNRENDSIAYHFAGIPFEDIYQVDILGRIHRMSDSKTIYNYGTIHKNIEQHFPCINQPKVRLYPS